jgi:hypothetical protein
MAKQPIDFQAFRNDFDDTIKALEAKYGINISAGNIRYTASGFNMAINAVKLSDDYVTNIAPPSWHSDVESLKLISPELYGKFFIRNEHVYCVVAWSKRSGYLCLNLTKSIDSEQFSYLKVRDKYDFERMGIAFDAQPVYNAQALFPALGFESYENVVKIDHHTLAVYIWDTRIVTHKLQHPELVDKYNNNNKFCCVSDSGKPLVF